MNQDKFKAAVEALTEAVSANSQASDLLQLLLADYYDTKTECEDQLRTIAGLRNAPRLADILAEIAPRRTAAIEELTAVTDEEKTALKNLAAAQADITIARQKIAEYIKVYDELRGNTDALKKNVKSMAGGLLKSLLGPAAELGPVKGLADKLFS